MDPRSLPSVDALARRLDAPHADAVRAARAVITERRAELRDGSDEGWDLVGRARVWLEREGVASPRRVINATGVLLHTNLGRAPLALAAREAVARVAEGYCDVELDLETGERGSRHAHVEALLCELTGAEAAMAVNNGAGAALLAVAALAGAAGAEVVVSRGQLVEIGGGFRIPDVVAQAGASLVEVGTTNRTRLADYSRALGPATAAVLRAHQSNFRQLGFVEAVEVSDLCGLGVPVIDDVGSGRLDDSDVLLGDEPSVRRSVEAGAALVTFSGDKLLGGPQAGLLVGTATAVEAARRHPLARALRADKLTLAALQATLRLWRDPAALARELPVARMLHASAAELDARAAALASATGGTVVDGVARVGGGALPLLELPGPVVALEVSGVPGDAEGEHASVAGDGADDASDARGVQPDRSDDASDAPDNPPAGGRAATLLARLRAHDPPVLARVHDGRVLLDPRTLTDAEVDVVAAAVAAARAGGG